MTKPLKQIHLAAHFPGVNNTTVWSDSGSGSHIEFSSFAHLAQTAERAKFDFLFLAVVVAQDEAEARELATGYGAWVRSIRSGRGAIQFPTPAEARAMTWTDAEREMVADRLETQFVGTPSQVAGQLEQLQEATGADELIITTITHGHADRVRSYELLAQEWARR